MEIFITAKQVGVLLQFAAKHDVRDYINAICIQTDGAKGYAVATDGAIMGVYKLHFQRPVEKCEIIVPRDILENVKSTSAGALVSISVEETSPSHPRNIAVRQGNSQWHGVMESRAYPDWRRLIPEKVSGEPANLSVTVYEKLCKAAKLVQGNKAPFFILGQNGTGASIVDLRDEDFIGIVMPIRVDKKDIARVSVRPEWVC